MSDVVERYRQYGDKAKALMFCKEFQHFFYFAANKFEADEKKIAELEAEIKRLCDAGHGKCKWCGVRHERGANTLCPFTIAEAEVKRLRESKEEDKLGNPLYDEASDAVKQMVRKREVE